jgi:hypothetical protein
MLHSIGEQQRAHAILVAGRCQGEHGANLYGKGGLGQRVAEVQRPRLIHDEQQRELALLGKALHERMAEACRDIPVDGAEIVAFLIGADFRELDALPAEHRAVLAGEQGIDQGASAARCP